MKNNSLLNDDNIIIGVGGQRDEANRRKQFSDIGVGLAWTARHFTHLPIRQSAANASEKENFMKEYGCIISTFMSQRGHWRSLIPYKVEIV